MPRHLSDKPAAVRKRRERELEAQGIGLASPRLSLRVFQAFEMTGLFNSLDVSQGRERRKRIDDAATAALDQWAEQIFSSRVTLMTTGRTYSCPETARGSP